ncbi:protein ZGRF1-like [Sturnira hondurensis]|uniref:protein ZGRF1-like n=1 Tax=Sturnira hondurensis TaxID=192404 RepID=UPI00187A4B34|nr:protein ZGRF1-like [Sturnira hondurensis]
MESQEFIVLYTHQKMKKSKVWQDGILKITHLGNKAILYDDKGQCLESLFLKCLEVSPGDDLESDRYLITVEEVRVAGSRAVHQKADQEASSLRPRQLTSSGRSLGGPPAGLKRKFTGFRGPRQMPKKMVIMENGESTVSLEAANPGPIFLSPFLRVPPLFSVAGKKDVNSVAADPEDTILSEDGGRNGPPLSSVASAQSSRGDPEGLLGGEHPVPLLGNEPVGRGSLSSHCSGAAQNVRSKAQILALLRSRSTSTCKEINSATAGRFTRVPPQGSLKIPTKPKCLTDQEECTEGSTGSLQYQQPSKNTMRNKSRWAAYLSSQSSPVHSSAADGNDLERKPMSPGDDINVNLRDLLVQKRIQFFETDAENRKNYDEDKLVGNTDSFCESSLPVTCDNVENDGLVSNSDVQENTNIPVNQNDWMCTKGSLVRENVQEIHKRGVPEKECEQTVSSLPASDCLPMQSLLNSNSRISNAITDMFSRSSADYESLNVQEPERNATQPVLEVNFNLSNFETSDAEEESQENGGIPQDPGGWEKDPLAGVCSSGVQKRGEAVHCEGGGSAPLPLLRPVRGKPTGTFSTQEALLSQFWGKAGPTGDGVEGWSDPALQWPEEVYIVHEDAETPTQKVRSNCHFASLPSKSKGINSNLHIPRFLSIDTNQTLESNLFSEPTQHQPFIMESDLDENDNQVLPLTSGSDNSIQLVNASQSHTDGCIALNKSDRRVSESLFYPLGRKQPISNDTEACVSESEDEGGMPSSAQGHTKGDSSGENRRYWKRPRKSSEPSGLGSISLLKSLTEHTTALEGLEILKKKHATCTPREMLQTPGPAGSPEARKPLVTVVSSAVPKSPPHLIQDSEQPVEFQGHRVQGSATSAVTVRGCSSQLACGQAPGCLEQHGCGAGTCFPGAGPPGARPQAAFLQFPDEENFPKGGDIFNIKDNFQVVAASNEDSIANDSILDFLPKDSELPYHCLDHNFKSAKRTSWKANTVMSPEQKVSTLSSVSTFSLDLQDEDFDLEFSEESLKARTLPEMKKFTSPGSHDLPRHPVLSRTCVPLVTAPTAPGPPPGGCAEPVVGLLRSRPEDQSEAPLCQASREVTSGAVSCLHGTPAQSKWLKYQNTARGSPSTPSRAQPSASASFAGAVCRMRYGAAGGNLRAVEDSLRGGDSTRLQVLSCALCGQQPGAGPRDCVCRNNALSLRSKPTAEMEAVQSVSGGSVCCSRGVMHSQEVGVSELCFPNRQKAKCASLPRRQTHIPAEFQSPSHYKQVFTSCLKEHLNILLFGLAQRLHKALSAVDMSFYTSNGEKLKTVENQVPSCHHHQPAKLVMVQKEGPNKGRLFYTCDAPRADRCQFFKWLNEVSAGHLTWEESPPAIVSNDMKGIGSYLRSRKVPLYEECQLLVRKGFDFQRKQHSKLKKFTTINPEFYNEPQSKLYLKLSRKERSSTYSKDDLWVVSKTLDFELDTFIACSAFFGPSSANEVELLPLEGYFPSRWSTDTVVHALLVCNASTELSTLKNIQDHFNPATLPLTQHLLAMSPSTAVSNKRVGRRKFIPPAFSNTNTKCDLPNLEAALQLANELIEAHKLNEDQATALTQIARMVVSHGRAEEDKGRHTCTLPITIIHGVFGAGKSYLLAVVILFFVQLFEKSEASTVGNARPWKLLVSSSTNVAVDRVLLGLLSLGFEKFVRVGSIRKIAKPILPHSLHAGSENANEQLKELYALMKEDLSPADRVHVRKSLEQHKLGTNRTLLRQVRVVGATCAACPFPCMDGLRFPVVVLDECSQMTEPASLLPVAR